MKYNQFSARTRICLVVALLSMVCLCSGCQAILATFLWLTGGGETKAKYKVFKGKTVAVVCLAETLTDPRFDDVPRDLAKNVELHLSQNVRKITVVPSSKVKKWLDRQDEEMSDFQEFGKAMEADMVLVIYLDSFETSSPTSPGSYQGHASTSFTVYEVSSGKPVASESLPELVYPPNSRVMATDVKESEFRKLYIHQLGWGISRFFYSYDHRQNMAMDAHAELAR